MVDEHTSLTMFNREGKKEKSYCVIRKNLAKDYEIEVDASEAPILNKIMSDPEPYESSLAETKILEQEVFPINDAIKNVFGTDEELSLSSIKLAVGGSPSDYVTVGINDLIRYNVEPTLTGLMDFVNENDESILGFLDCEYISEEGNVIYLSCGKKDVSKNIRSIKLKILASMQQRGFFLQEEHKYYGLQLYLIIETLKPNDDKLLELLKELEIDWELIFFRRRLAIHDWTEIECDRNPENLKKYLRTKYNNLNYFDLNNIIRVVVKNELPFIVADKMASLLFKMKAERTLQYKLEAEQQYDMEFNSKAQIEEERADLIDRINLLRRQKQIQPSNENITDLKMSRDRKNDLDNEKRRVVEKLRTLRDKIDNPEDVYSVSLKKAEIAASAKLACAYLGIDQEIKFDRDISIAEILKYQEELTNI